MASPVELELDLSLLASTPGAFVVGLSGGLDSSVLLHALASLPAARDRGLRAVHVHHGLHADADDWQARCERLCASLDVPLRSIRVCVEPAGDGPEAAARRARHAALASALDRGDILALAHHRDDQAETFLMRALRASGPDGLRAMRDWRAFGHGWLWRPLLATPRARLAHYAGAHRLEWVEDPSNVDTRFDRNFLRARVLPLLRERWPHADAALARSAQLCADAADLLAHDDDALLRAARTVEGDLDAATLREATPARRARVLRLWVAGLGLAPLPAQGVRAVEAMLAGLRDDAGARFDWHGATIRAWRGRLHGGRVLRPLGASLDLAWNGLTPLALPDGGRLEVSPAVALPPGTRVRARAGGERIRLPGRERTHSLKHALQSAGVPPWLRE
uniref:tRNA lysidine(34) synthetase TilS n=1 Tax=Cognatilysobacter segetis TaxID=2492394 RepID=UPI00105BA1D2